MKKPTKKFILFDLDGTLIDTVDLIYQSFRYATKELLGKNYSRSKLLRNLGRPLEVQMSYFSKPLANQLVEVYLKHNHALHDRYVKAYPEARETLSSLRQRGYKIAVVTSKRTELARRGLSLTNLIEFVDKLVAMEDTKKHKPDPEPILLALRQLKAKPSQSVFVGDSPFDISAGNKAKLTTVAALWGPFDHRILLAQGPDLAANRISDLLVYFS